MSRLSDEVIPRAERGVSAVVSAVGGFCRKGKRKSSRDLVLKSWICSRNPKNELKNPQKVANSKACFQKLAKPGPA